MASQAQKDRAAEVRERIVELSRQGLAAEVIADKFNVSERSVQRARQHAGLARAQRYGSEDEKLKAKLMLNDGCSYEEVTRTLSRASTTVAAWHPGYQWTRQQCTEAAAMTRKMNRLTDRLGESRKPAGTYR